MVEPNIRALRQVADDDESSHAMRALYNGDHPDLRTARANELFERLRDGDERATELLYLQYYSRLLRFAYSYLQSRPIAEEIVQDVFLTLWERRGTLDIKSSVNAYLYAAVRNRAFHLVRHERVITESEASADLAGTMFAMGEAPCSPHVRLEDNELAAHVTRAVKSLSERRRLALILRWRHQLSYAEIAEIMGTSVDAVSVQVSRAREQVARLIRGYTGIR